MHMRNLLLWLSLSLPLFAQAQITYPQSALPVPGDVIWRSTADTLVGIDPALSGTNYSWDYSQVSALVQQKDTFVAFSSVTLFLRLLFPQNTNLVRFIETPDSLAGVSLANGYEFFHKSAGAFRQYGFGSTFSGLPIALVNQPADTLFKLPMTYGDSGDGYTEASVSIPGLAYYRQRRTRQYEVDGWGTVMTPHGSFASLRLKTTISGEDSISVSDTLINFSGPTPTQRTYQWWAVEESAPVLEISTLVNDSSNTEIVTQVAFVDTFRPDLVILSVPKPQSQTVGIFPNPASNQTRISAPGSGALQGQMEIMSLDGRVVQRLTVNDVATDLDVWGLPDGVYLIRLTRSSGVFQGKLVVKH